jgi:lon-related putative ATP-dependent protease
LAKEDELMIEELTADRTHRVCPPQQFDLATTEEAGALETIIGQERAVRALRFGLGIKNQGFNIYVAGLPGTGKTTAVKQFLEEVAAQKPVPPDWCYLHGFSNSDRPNAIQLPAGMAMQFKAEMEKLLGLILQDIRTAFESEEYLHQQEEIIKSFDQKKQEIFDALNQQATEHGFILQATPMGLLTVPLFQGKPLSEQEFLALSPAEKDDISQKQQQVQAILESSIRQGKSQDIKAREALQELDRRVAEYTIRPPILEMSEKYAGIPEVEQYLEQVSLDIIENRASFKPEQADQATPPSPGKETKEQLLKRYQVNVLVDNTGLSGAPVVLETNPTFSNLCGRIEQEARFGALTTDFTLIRKGCLHQANGGYLVIPVLDLLRSPLAWETLKRALENHAIAIEEAGEKLGFLFTRTLRPEPIPLEVKVVLIGSPEIYQLLLQADDKFIELFKVKADFDYQIEWNDASLADYAAFARKVCTAESLRHLDPSALSRLIEHGARLAGHQQKLSTRFGELADVIREASYYAVQEDQPYVTALHVRQAIEAHEERSNLLQDRLQEMIEQGVIKIQVTGEQVGQANGLSVFELGRLYFGQPNRITASISIGRQGVIDIEREARLGGPIHTKGVLILSGYLAEKFAQEAPLSLTARLVFEQSYAGVEGDSASSTELYALLSALADLPVRQGIAVTGSVNQKGEVQAIGGVNEKIEGFFVVCQSRGLTGEQGVLIPASNVAHLMLKERVVQAVREGRFHIWPVETVEQGIEVLTGVPAGTRREGGYETGTVYAQVDARLRGFAEKLVKFRVENG